jgi:hypothetical protein
MATQDKKVTVFDIVKIMTTTERKWSDLSDEEKNVVEPFMIIMILSMHPDLLEICNEFQRYAISSDLSPREVYTFFNELLPKRSYYSTWIKGTKDSSYNDHLISLIAQEYECSKTQAYEYLNILTESNNIEAIVKIVSKYGYTEAQVEAIILNKTIPTAKPKKVAAKKTKSK